MGDNIIISDISRKCTKITYSEDTVLLLDLYYIKYITVTLVLSVIKADIYKPHPQRKHTGEY